MKKLTVVATIILAVMAFMFVSLMAQDAAKPAETKKTFAYVGADKCKICHKVEHTTWLASTHAKAWDRLKPEEQKKEECIGCHSTGKLADGTLLTGVQCESCHGPGSEYKAQKVMKDKALALASGLVEPKNEVCVTCHNEKSPTFKGFKFEEAVKNTKAIHEKTPKKEATPKG